MDNDKKTESEKNLCLETVTELLRLRNSIEHTLAPITQRFGLTPMQTAALNFINSNSASTVGSVFRALELNQGNASSMCKRLEADGFIHRRRSEEDERCVFLEVTERGKAAILAVERETADFFPAPDDIAPDDKTRIEESLKTIKSFAEAIRKKLNDSEISEE